MTASATVTKAETEEKLAVVEPQSRNNRIDGQL